jgi:hypothetical protein
MYNYIHLTLRETTLEPDNDDNSFNKKYIYYGAHVCVIASNSHNYLIKAHSFQKGPTVIKLLTDIGSSGHKCPLIKSMIEACTVVVAAEWQESLN